MLILSQNGEVMVNVNNLQVISIYPLGDLKAREHRILAWCGNTEDDCFGIGDYSTEERAKEIIKEIWNKYGEYLHRTGGSAILKGSVDVQEAFLVLPKVYKMPEK